MTWQQFVQKYGRGLYGHHLAAITGQPLDAIERFRRTVSCEASEPRTFNELFPLFNGRAPRDDEWPRPRRVGSQTGYEWLGPELTLLASLTGRIAPDEIGRILTARLRTLTGDPQAVRTPNTINSARQRTGLWSADVLGGLTATQAGRSIGCTSIVYNDIARGRLKASRVGRLLVIAHDEWARWKAARVFPPAGFVSLSSLKQPLGITSDKLSEWARMGYVPSAIRCNPYGTRAASTQFGTWYIDPKIRKKLIADRRAGRPMPWWRKPEPSNLAITWRLWQTRQHPATCEICRTIWGRAGAPTTFEDYSLRYPPLAHGAKRHMTRPWFEGLSVKEVARHVNLTPASVLYAIRSGVLRASKRGRCGYIVTKTDATRWKARHCPTGEGRHCWLQLATAEKFYGFSRRELLAHIRAGRLRSKVGTEGPMRGHRYVLKQQLRELRETTGFLEVDAARRLRISVPRLRQLARHADWRAGNRYTIDVINTIRKRIDSASGLPIAAAARALKKSVAWVEREIANGTARVLRTPFNAKRRYISAPMMKRLRAAVEHPTSRPRWTSEWLLVSDAALVAGTSIGTVQKWADAGEVKFRIKSPTSPVPARTRRGHRRYHRRSVMKRARQYWTSEVRFKRATPPAWLSQEAA